MYTSDDGIMPLLGQGSVIIEQIQLTSDFKVRFVCGMSTNDSRS